MISTKLLSKWKQLFRPYSYPSELERAIGDAHTVLDLGCGYPSPIRGFSQKFHSTGVDAFESSIEKSRAEGIHNEYLQMNVLDVGDKIPENSYDCVLASDLIEHLEKPAGFELLRIMERIARHRVVLFTPNGFLSQGVHSGNPWQIHHSGWEVSEWRQMGYTVIGINGKKNLRGELATTSIQPELLGEILSDLTQPYYRTRPEGAFQLLCVKELPPSPNDSTDK